MLASRPQELLGRNRGIPHLHDFCRFVLSNGEEQGQIARTERYRALNIHCCWTRNSLRFISDENHRALFVSYRPDGLAIRYSVDEVAEDSSQWTLTSKRGGLDSIRCGNERFSIPEAIERLSRLIELLLGPGKQQDQSK